MMGTRDFILYFTNDFKVCHKTSAIMRTSNYIIIYLIYFNKYTTYAFAIDNY